MIHLARFALTVSAAVVLLAGCDGSQLPFGALNGMSARVADSTLPPPPTPSNYKILTNFAEAASASSTGKFPSSSLLDVNGKLYGTTAMGGAWVKELCLASPQTAPRGCLTIFTRTPMRAGP